MLSGAVRAAYRIGEQVCFHAFTSCSTDFGCSTNPAFMGNGEATLFVIKAKGGCRAIKYFSAIPGENEVLFNVDQIFTVTHFLTELSEQQNFLSSAVKILGGNLQRLREFGRLDVIVLEE
eukprot:NODE_2805_length_639_cov_82.450847_g2329_i0.p1 GENE.NODE_2805_length_639_cov_82.450847_g2329_i0~~NODE_2805_length_639_cov_82.450847_g2329_i0.p1  ORF type:complete len:136 (+),score=31.98 NODE_2805_length_639_cov_82.450847_g2329_i0:50-409(+)